MVERVGNANDGRPVWQRSFKRDIALKMSAEVVAKGVAANKRVGLLDDTDTYLVVEVVGGNIKVCNERTQRQKDVGIGAIDRVLE